MNIYTGARWNFCSTLLKRNTLLNAKLPWHHIRMYKISILAFLIILFTYSPVFCREYRAPKPIDFKVLLYDKVKLPAYKQYISSIRKYDKLKLEELSKFFIFLYTNKLDKAFSQESSYILNQIKRINKLEKPVFYNVLNISLLKNIRYKTTTVFFRKHKIEVANKIIGSIKNIDNNFSYIKGITREINIVISKKRNHDCSNYLVNEKLPDDAIYKKSLNLYLLQKWNQIGQPDDNVIRKSLFSFILDPELEIYDQNIINYFFVKNNLEIDIDNLEPSRLYSETIQNYSVFLKHLWSYFRNTDPIRFNLVLSATNLFTNPEMVFKNSGLSFLNMISKVKEVLLKNIFALSEIKMEFMDKIFIFILDHNLKKSYKNTRECLLRIPSMAFRIISVHPEIGKLDSILVKFTDSISKLYEVTKNGFLINSNHPEFLLIKFLSK